MCAFLVGSRDGCHILGAFSADLRLATGKKFTLVGTPEGDEIKDPSRSYIFPTGCRSSPPEDHIELEFLPDVVNDLDVDFSEDLAASDAYKNDQRNVRKVKEATEKLELNIIHPLREGKKLLVLDIDYSEHPAGILPHLVLLEFQPYWTRNR